MKTAGSLIGILFLGVASFGSPPLWGDPLVTIELQHQFQHGLQYLGEIRAEPDPSDLARNLVDRLELDTLEAMRARGLEESRLEAPPWSGWFFPLSEGGLAYRHGDPNFPKDASWRVLQSYLLSTIGQVPEDQLSPIEKYDVLLGDPQFTMTRKMIQLATSHSVGPPS